VVPDLPLLSIVLRLTVTATGTFPLLSTTPIIFSLPWESMNDCCFVIFTELSTYAATANEGNGRRENVKTTYNTNTDTKSPTITLILLLVIF
jgi:hypothetical protein